MSDAITGLIYIEFRSRNPGVGLDVFHRVSVTRWTDEYPEDRLLLYIGRTWRIGPDQPEYLAVYYTPGGGLGRLDQWDQIFKSGDVDQLELVRLATSRIDRAGCYRPLLTPLPAAGGPYYLEHFAAPDDLDDESVMKRFVARTSGTKDVQLHLLARRIGRLAPDPGGIAIWSLSTFEQSNALEPTSSGEIQVLDAGLYHDVGQEVL